MNGAHAAPALFFDLDGTLTDPKVGITRCIQYALQEMGEPVPSTEALLWCIGPPLQASFEHLVGSARAAEAVGLYRQRFADVGLFENDPYPEIHDTLEALAQTGARMFVASSKPLVFVERILQRYELAGFFSAVYGSELDGTRTDKTELLAYALRDSAVQAAGATMIGDRKHDAIGARNNDLEFIGVLYGYGDRQEFAEVGAQVTIDVHPQLLDIFT
jgi:phosphoglycolate phosphatase